jgi:acyl carrier protein
MNQASSVSASPIESISQIRATVARLLHEQMGIDPELALQDTPFIELHKDFDSLSFMELQLLLEKEYKTELEESASHDPALLPKTCTELAQALQLQLNKKAIPA